MLITNGASCLFVSNSHRVQLHQPTFERIEHLLGSNECWASIDMWKHSIDFTNRFKVNSFSDQLSFLSSSEFDPLPSHLELTLLGLLCFELDHRTVFIRGMLTDCYSYNCVTSSILGVTVPQISIKKFPSCLIMYSRYGRLTLTAWSTARPAERIRENFILMQKEFDNMSDLDYDWIRDAFLSTLS